MHFGLFGLYKNWVGLVTSLDFGMVHYHHFHFIFDKKYYIFLKKIIN